MIKHTLLCLFVIFLLSACVAYPTSRTYFKPNPNDGQLTPSMGCGYHTTKNDAVIKQLGDETITVMPEYVSGEKFKITLLLATKPKTDIVLLTDRIAVEVLNSAIKIYPVELTVTQVPSVDGKKINQWITLIFPLTADEIEAFDLTIPLSGSSESLPEDGLLNFNFEKVEAADFYYNSINC
ncbi:hypothetical protein [uncultured Shewanella sp.]|uniref:hypothetical protein n=1 Tax=Shewanella atlantica TaxID=271099 RepID=UPI0026334E22|nr:hypothetical protein [uncultured Shewanella sp.]